ncbi:extracelular serine carboxypeptidase [Polychaeton citri CBS 116435]|uniref:Extracelular serine carboxypeptidase n=1 Tax=Polychaeton citri CBS 116435 TaxID=1314669 RepID=A0A9P4QG66_9PEZI|nr:extracelular serine carboxypeptidase [Polychaeton citri CBS 116435]
MWLQVKMVASLCLTAGVASARQSSRATLQARQGEASYTPHFIDMPIDHFQDKVRYEPHSNATFRQRYFYDHRYYKPGGPVFLYIGGETSGESRFSNLETGIIQVLMAATNGLGIIIENRYYGDSYPFEESTTDNLRFLSTEQTIADNAYLAQHATFPGVNSSGHSLNAPDTPWIMYGGSLAGGQVAFTMHEYSNVLWGGIASSGVTKAQLAYPEWYNPIQKFAPQDCVASINSIVDKIDHVFATGNATSIRRMKSVFGLADLEDNRDFAQTIAFPIGGPFTYPTNTWQELNWNLEDGSNDFWYFCNNVTDVSPPANTSYIDTALSDLTSGEAWTNLGNYANYISTYIVGLCPDPSLINTSLCFSTQNQSFYANTTNTDGRSYLYQTCTEVGAYQVAPDEGPSLISRQLQINYTQQWCDWAFPRGKLSSIPESPNIGLIERYGGYTVKADRLAFIDGDQDVWNDLCYHSEFAPKRHQDVEGLHPELLITGGGHHWDSYSLTYSNLANEPQFIRAAHDWEIRTVKRWLQDWHATGPSTYQQAVLS